MILVPASTLTLCDFELVESTVFHRLQGNAVDFHQNLAKTKETKKTLVMPSLMFSVLKQK